MAAKKETFKLLTPVRVDGVLYRGEVTCEPEKLKGLDHCIAKPAAEPEPAPEQPVGA